MTKKKRRINLFDIIIILLVAAVAAAVFLFTRQDTAAVETRNVKYVIEIQNVPEGFTKKIDIGDDITDNIKNYYMGKVVAAEAAPWYEQTENREAGTAYMAAVPGRECAVITLEAPVTDSGSELRVNGNFLVRGGIAIAAKGPGYAGEGYILMVER